MKLVLIVLFLLTFSKMKAQSFKVTLSDEFSLKNKAENYNETFKDEIVKLGNYYYRKEIGIAPMKFGFTARLRDGLHGLTIYKYDSKMKEIKKVSLGNNQRLFGPLGDMMFIHGNKLTLLYYTYEKDDSARLFITEINQNTLEITNSIQIYSYFQKNVGLTGLLFNSGNVSGNKLKYCFSPDSSKMLIQTIGIPGEIFSILLDKKLQLSNGFRSNIPEGKDFEINSIFLDNQDNRYTSFGNRINKKDKELTRGILIQNSTGKEIYKNIFPTNGKFLKEITFGTSRNNKRIYAYANFFGKNLCEGIYLITIDNLNQAITKETFFPYPEEFKKRVYKLDFGDKSSGEYSLFPISYIFNELSDGTISLVGVPYYTVSTEKYVRIYAGPIVIAFINESKSNFTIIPRKQDQFEGSSCIAYPFANNLVCIYNDRIKNLTNPLKDDVSNPGMYGNAKDFKLAAAVISPDGLVVSRSIIGEELTHNNRYYIDNAQKINNGKYSIQIGHTGIGFSSYYTAIQQIAELEVK